MINRRHFLGLAAGTGASLALSPDLLRALQRSGRNLIAQLDGPLIQRAIPSSGELLPAVGLSFSNHPGCADHAVLTEVLKTFAGSGGRVYDVLHVNPTNEQFHIDAASELGIQNKLFWSMRGNPANAAPAAELVKPHIESLLSRTKASKIDLAMVPVASDHATIAALNEQKQSGRVRYTGVQTISVSSQAAQLEAIMGNEPIDFIGVDYDVSNRVVETRILPLARERKIGVMAFFPFNNASGLSCTGGTNLFSRVAGKPLPEWAAEFDAKSWAQFFLKYVIGHPAITVARMGTTKVTHALDDIGGGIGRLPDEAMRKRMAEFIDALPRVSQPAPATQGPAVMSAALLDRYVGNYRTADGIVISVHRYGTTLVAKRDTDPDTVLIPRSETRFTLGNRGTDVIEFQPDSAGTVASLTYERGNSKTAASRIR